MRVEPAVPRAHVVAAWDCGLGAGRREVALRSLRLRFEEPSPLRHVPLPGDPDPRDWSLPFALGIGGAAACAAGWIALRGARRRLPSARA